MRIALERLPEQVEREDNLLFLPISRMREGTQVQIVSGEIIGRPSRRSADLRGLQRRFAMPATLIAT
jgi:hypothetical protein